MAVLSIDLMSLQRVRGILSLISSTERGLLDKKWCSHYYEKEYLALKIILASLYFELVNGVKQD